MDISTTDLCDLYSEDADLGLQIALPGLLPLGGSKCMHGLAVTVSCIDDNVLVRELVGTPGEGRILVIDGHASPRRALLGDIQATRAMNNGWAGMLINGYVRDKNLLAELPFAVFALGTVPLRPLKERTGEVGVEVRFSNLTINPGQWIYADSDGVIVFNRSVELLSEALSEN